MKYTQHILLLSLLQLCLMCAATAQKPSKEQMEADKKRLAEAMQKLNEKVSKMNPAARKGYDSMLNLYGVGQKMNSAVTQVSNNQKTTGLVYNGLVLVKNTKAIASIAGTPAVAKMGAYVNTVAANTFAAVLPAAKNKAGEVYNALKNRGASAGEMGKAATVLWLQGRTQIALSMMAQVCEDEPANTDNLNNYASMLTMMGAADMAIPILNNLNTRFKNNSTILNNLGQAWFALGDMNQSKKYLDSTLMFAATHAQANETLCLVAESKGDKTAAIAYAKTAFKKGNTASRKDKLQQLGYMPGADAYSDFPPGGKSDDLLNLGGFSQLEFPKSYAAMTMYQQQWKQYSADIDERLKPLKKTTDESNKITTERLQEQQKNFMRAMNKTLANPGSVSQAGAMQIAGAPMFAEKMNAKEKMMLDNLLRKKNAVVQEMKDFMKGEGAAYKTAYNATMQKINARWKDVGEGGTENNGTLCNDAVKAVDTYLAAYNTKYEELYIQYLAAEKQYLNELAYLSLYTTYPELLPGINAGLKMQWLNDLAFKAEVLQVNYACASQGSIKAGKLTAFKDPNCAINSDFGAQLGLVNAGFNMHLDCNGLTTTINAAAIGVTLNQDLDHAGFGDSYKNCTVSIGPKASLGGKLGPLEASVSAGVGVDIEIDRNGYGMWW